MIVYFYFVEVIMDVRVGICKVKPALMDKYTDTTNRS